MGGLKEAILENVVKPHSKSSFGTVKAEVFEFDNITHRAKIVFKDPQGTGFIKLDNVPVQIGSGGVHSAGPLVGDQVWVSFVNNSPLNPKIVSLADEAYQVNTREKTKHVRKGALIPDNLSERESSSNAVQLSLNHPTINDWFDDDNTDYGKYISYKETDPLNTLIQATSTSAYYSAEEPGITHPVNSSTIKVRNTGAIDIFVSTNQGIRIDPSTKTINFIANSEKHHVSDLAVFSDNNVSIESKKNTSVTAKSCTVKTEQLSMVADSCTTEIKDKWTLVVNSDILIKSNSNVTLDAAEDLNLTGKRIVFKGSTFINRDDILKSLNMEG